MQSFPVSGAGLGYRREMKDEIGNYSTDDINFMEVVPENWIGLGGSMKRQLKAVTERFPMVMHGLSLSIGGPGKLDVDLVKTIGQFMEEHNVRCYTEHLSYCSDDGQLYDLMPIPFTEEGVHYTANRIKQVQDILGQRIGMENVSYYAAPGQEMAEIEFINAVIEESDCGLLLDVNNIYVNSINHQYDAEEYLKQLPGERVMYLHTAGHYVEAEDLRVDTHGADVIDPVWDLLDVAYQQFGVMPTLLERDNNVPPLPTLMAEVEKIAAIQKKYTATNINQNQHG
ncbi:MAG: HvfB family MNIO-type RiPP peptide maturase [bacterium]